MRPEKATKSQVRTHNRKMVLRAIYEADGTNRAALAQETGLSKPTVSELVAELMEEGLVVEEGLGESTESGGKRPRLLCFLPEARQVIGVGINPNYILGALTSLNGHVIVEHQAALASTDVETVFNTLVEVINGLIAQCSAPLLCMGVGISAIIDDRNGVVLSAPRMGWHNVPLAKRLSEHYNTTVYLSNSTELVARAEFAFGNFPDVPSLATVQIGNGVGVGAVHHYSDYHSGSEIGSLMIDGGNLEQRLGWPQVRQRALELGAKHNSLLIAGEDISYLHIRWAAFQEDEAAVTLLHELSCDVAQIFAWVIALIGPTCILLAGAMANLGQPFLAQVIAETRRLILPELVDRTQFAVDDNENLVSIGAAAKAVQSELGLV